MQVHLNDLAIHVRVNGVTGVGIDLMRTNHCLLLLGTRLDDFTSLKSIFI